MSGDGLETDPLGRYYPGVRLLFLAALVFAAGCRPDYVGARELDELERALAVTPAQRPAWEAFRREAEAAGSPQAGWRTRLREATAGERFDARGAQSAADAAREDAGRLIEAWSRLDELLTPEQRAALRK